VGQKTFEKSVIIRRSDLFYSWIAAYSVVLINNLK
jgi:hypothetical protein